MYNRPAGFVSNINSKIHSIFDTVLFPMLSEIQDDRTRVTSVFYRAISLLNSFSVVLASAFFFNSELIITLFFGEKWLDLVPVMRIASLGVIFSVDSRLVDCFFRSLNYVKLGAQIRAVGVFITLLFLYIGARYGIIGVAWGILIANISLVIIKMISLAFKVKAKISMMFSIWLKSWKPAILPVLIGCVYTIIPHNLIMNILFVMIFIGVLMVEYVVYPQIVGQEYLSSVYPIVEKVLNKIIKK